LKKSNMVDNKKDLNRIGYVYIAFSVGSKECVYDKNKITV
jgi:hypothetical protein